MLLIFSCTIFRTVDAFCDPHGTSYNEAAFYMTNKQSLSSISKHGFFLCATFVVRSFDRYCGKCIVFYSDFAVIVDHATDFMQLFMWANEHSQTNHIFSEDICLVCHYLLALRNKPSVCLIWRPLVPLAHMIVWGAQPDLPKWNLLKGKIAIIRCSSQN